jgi:UrcA family protein
MRTLIVGALVAAGLAGPAFAYEQNIASNADQVRVVTVSKAGVDFSNPRSVGVLYARLKHAALKACSPDSADHLLALPEQACVDQALARVVRHADKPLLTAAYQADATAQSRALAGNDQ